MTPQELHAALDERRKALGWPWWKVAAAVDISSERLRPMRYGVLSPALRERCEEWLRRQAQPRT